MPINYFGSGGSDSGEKESKAKKTLIVLFAFFAVFLVFFSFRQLKTNIYSPFAFMNEDEENMSEAESDLAARYRLQDMDTDGDGLSDYDEIYVYGTSPYLADTDSDGISDYDEIMQNTDPLCPEGQDCYGLEDSFELNPNDFLDSSTNEESEAIDGLEIENSEEFKIIEEIISGEVDASILRKLLVDNGFEEEELNQISDEELKSIYFEIVSEQLKNQE